MYEIIYILESIFTIIYDNEIAALDLIANIDYAEVIAFIKSILAIFGVAL